MRRYFLLLPVLAVITASLADQNRPDMKLLVSTHSGERPLSLTLTGRIAGMKPEEFGACLLTVEGDITTPGGQKLISKNEIPCVEAEPSAGSPSAVPDTFTRQLTLPDAGTFSYRIVLVRNDGKRMASTSQEVKVYRSRYETGVVRDGSLNRR